MTNCEIAEAKEAKQPGVDRTPDRPPPTDGNTDLGYDNFWYACHEGNHALAGILAGARIQERDAAAASQ